MNIFVLDNNINKCARYHCDKHVVKMILEGAQILCTVCNKHNIKTPYKTTHSKHPCVVWAEESIQNWRWLRKLVYALSKEYKYRYNNKKDHKSFLVVKKLLEPNLPKTGITKHCQVMSENLHIPNDPVTAYRNYYIKQKKSIATWTRRKPPKWYLS